MRVAGSIFLSLLALQVQGIHISNSTREATGPLWTMVDNPDLTPDNGLSKKIFDRLESYALWCCDSIYPPPKPTQNCATLQIGYYAYIPEENYLTMTQDELLLWVDLVFDPRLQNPGTAADMCAAAPSKTQPFPNFAAAPRGTGGDHHTEATLLQPMTYMASQQKEQTVFFLYSRNSPCCTNDNGNCQQKIFQFTSENLYALDNVPFHKLVVGFPQWYMYPNPTTITEVRKSFCGRVDEYKTSPLYSNKDFFRVLFFQKTREQTDNEITDGDFEQNLPDGYC